MVTFACLFRSTIKKKKSQKVYFVRAHETYFSLCLSLSVCFLSVIFNCMFSFTILTMTTTRAPIFFLLSIFNSILFLFSLVCRFAKFLKLTKKVSFFPLISYHLYVICFCFCCFSFILLYHILSQKIYRFTSN